MFERFTEGARQVIVLAQDEARQRGHGSIGTEHLLVGLLREEEGLAAQVLGSLDITIDRVRAEVARLLGRGESPAAEKIPLTPDAKEVLELAVREALSLGHNYIGTEHLLLAVVRGDECPAARILLDLGAGAEEVRDNLIRAMTVRGAQRGSRSREPRWQQDISESLEALVERLDQFVPGGALIPRRRARRLVQDAIRRHDREAESRLGRHGWHALVEEVLDANPDVEPA